MNQKYHRGNIKMTFILPECLITIDLNVFSEALKVHSRINKKAMSVIISITKTPGEEK